ncbi:NUDIX domain-containing protein [Streptomyces sp. NPDC020719]|uniref:NUDIX domain-containing protein n=1 Tax=Streptomyces sp. NPDC020719 TaxID=3154896 RepID=UPI0033D4A656
MATSATVQRHRRICDVHLVLIRDGHVLLSLRQGGYAAGQWQVPSGHLDAGEPTDDGTAREGFEEIGITVNASDLELAHFIDHRAPGEEPRLGVFYRALAWDGEPLQRRARQMRRHRLVPPRRRHPAPHRALPRRRPHPHRTGKRALPLRVGTRHHPAHAGVNRRRPDRCPCYEL